MGIILSRMLEETVQGKEQGTGIAGHAGDGYGGLGHHGGQNDPDVDQRCCGCDDGHGVGDQTRPAESSLTVDVLR